MAFVGDVYRTHVNCSNCNYVEHVYTWCGITIHDVHKCYVICGVPKRRQGNRTRARECKGQVNPVSVIRYIPPGLVHERTGTYLVVGAGGGGGN